MEWDAVLILEVGEFILMEGKVAPGHKSSTFLRKDTNQLNLSTTYTVFTSKPDILVSFTLCHGRNFYSGRDGECKATVIILSPCS